ncbi:MAG: glycerophosphodiester phosphodiesterase [Nitrospirota bacterium]|nr:glycerophosphodiester phosphodiesterase [Nitrospirota bacterium]
METLTPATDRPWVIAHRGASADYPENTLPAFDAAAALPLDAIELDLQRSRDGVAVVYHDRTLRKLGLPRKRVAGRTWEALRQLDAGAHFSPRFEGTRLTTLDQVLDRYSAQVPLMLEIKRRGAPPSVANHQALVRTILDGVRARGVENRVFLLSFWPELLEYAMHCAPGIRCVWNLEHPERPSVAVGRRIEAMFGVCVNLKTVTRDFADYMHGLSRPLLCWAVNTSADLKRAREIGVDGLISDRPEWLCGQLNRVETA